jgi:hypothetical protein
MDEWSLWVLEHGLPPLPTSVQKGDSVPVARWAGITVDAVLHVQWMRDDDEPDDDFLGSQSPDISGMTARSPTDCWA